MGTWASMSQYLHIIVSTSSQQYTIRSIFSDTVAGQISFNDQLTMLYDMMCVMLYMLCNVVYHTVQVRFC